MFPCPPSSEAAQSDIAAQPDDSGNEEKDGKTCKHKRHDDRPTPSDGLFSGVGIVSVDYLRHYTVAAGKPRSCSMRMSAKIANR
jgi:hypothetical protein